jgi:hypothetical protein
MIKTLNLKLVGVSIILGMLASSIIAGPGTPGGVKPDTSECAANPGPVPDRAVTSYTCGTGCSGLNGSGCCQTINITEFYPNSGVQTVYSYCTDSGYACDTGAFGEPANYVGRCVNANGAPSTPPE